MVRIHTGRDIRIEIFALQTRCMAVDFLMVGLGRDNFCYRKAVRVDNAREIHHLRQAQHPRMIEEAVYILIVQIRTRFIQGGCGYTGGNHKPHIHRKFLRGMEHIVNTCGIHDVCDLMRVGDDSGSTVRNNRPGKLGRADQAGLQMNMGIDKTGTDDFPRHVHFLDTVIAAQTHNEAMGNGDILSHQFSGEHIDIGGVFQHQVCLLSACCHINDLLLLNQFPVDFAGPAFLRCHKRFLLTLSFYDTIKKEVYKTKNCKLFL